MRTDEQDLGRHALKERISCPPPSHLPAFFTLGFFYSFPSFLRALFPFFFHLAEHIFHCRRTLTPPSSLTLPSTTHQTRAPAPNATLLPPAKHKQNLLPSCALKTKSSSRPFFFFFFSPVLSVLSSFSLTISCGGLRTHQLS